MPMRVSIVVPFFNEEKNIEATIGELKAYMLQYAGATGWEVIAVNDGSEDRTLQILNRMAQVTPALKVVDLESHCGRGKALRSGIDAASGEMIVTLEADLSYAPYHIERLLGKLIEEKADIVVASAYGEGGTVKNVPANRLWISKTGNKILSYMFGGSVTVLTCMVRAYKRDFIKGIDLYSDDKEIHLEILSKAKILGAKIAEIPADLNWREGKRAKNVNKKKVALRRSTLRFKKTSSSHLFFALLSRPGIIFWIPGIFLMSVSLFILFNTVAFIILDPTSSDSLYQAVRNSMLNASLSWLTMAFSFLLGIQFFTLGFLTNQSKNHREETYRTLNSIYREIKNKDKN